MHPVRILFKALEIGGHIFVLLSSVGNRQQAGIFYSVRDDKCMQDMKAGRKDRARGEMQVLLWI